MQKAWACMHCSEAHSNYFHDDRTSHSVLHEVGPMHTVLPVGTVVLLLRLLVVQYCW